MLSEVLISNIFVSSLLPIRKRSFSQCQNYFTVLFSLCDDEGKTIETTDTCSSIVQEVFDLPIFYLINNTSHTNAYHRKFRKLACL